LPDREVSCAEEEARERGSVPEAGPGRAVGSGQAEGQPRSVL